MPPFHGQPQSYFSEMILINYLIYVFLNLKRKYCQSSSITNIYCLLCTRQCVTCCTYIIYLSLTTTL